MPDLPMRLLVTGATGFVGQALCARLKQDKMALRAAVRSPIAALSAPAHTIVGEINGATDWQKALHGVTDVIHLAARVHVMIDRAKDPLSEFRRVNVQGTLNLAQQAAAAGVRRLVYVSSIKVNGEATPAGQAFCESDVPNPQDAYAVSKHEAEQVLYQVAAQTGMEVVVIRPPLIYGPGVKANFAALMQAVQQGWPLPFGAVHNLRSLVALDNLVDFVLTCSVHTLAANQTFLISDGHDLSTADLVRGLAQVAGVSARLIQIPTVVLNGAGRLFSLFSLGDAIEKLCSNLQVDIAKAQGLLGWRPPVTVKLAVRPSSWPARHNRSGNSRSVLASSPGRRTRAWADGHLRKAPGTRNWTAAMHRNNTKY